MRRKVKNRNKVSPDRKYESLDVAKFINHIMERGKKATATRIVYDALEIVADKSKKEALSVFNTAIDNAAPLMEIRSRRIGGANYQVPREVRAERRQFLGMKWIKEAANAGKGRPMHAKLADEILAASNNEGEAIKKRENVHKMAEANKAFAHFAW